MLENASLENPATIEAVEDIDEALIGSVRAKLKLLQQV
jgi:hypothetical protein